MLGRLPNVRKMLGFYVLLPVILDIIIESLNRKSFLAAVTYVVDRPFLFLFNVLIIMLTLSVAMFFKREIFVLSLISMVWLVFGIVNFVILHFRVTPFSAVDFTLISSAISVSGHYLTVLNVAMVFMAAAIIVVSVVCIFRKAPSNHNNVTKRAYIISAVIVLVIISSIAVIRSSSTSVQALAEDYTNISEAYENYGFVYCFTNSLLDTGIDKPEDYSEESVKKITTSLKEEKSTATEKPDIVMVQLESFFDICNVEGLSFSKDPLPNFHRLQKYYSNGLVTVPTVGAGTVNTEFEVLTGMSQQDFGVCEYPYKTVLKSKTSESICYDLAPLGYTSHAVHNNTATFYGRNKVFANLGFDTFTSVEYMNDITLNPNGWAKDDVLLDEIIHTLDSTQGPDFSFCITVQSHGKYDGVELEEEPKVDVYNAPEDKEAAYQYYVNQIYEVDEMIGKLVAALSKRETPTVLVLYGDHMPSLDLTDDDLNGQTLYQTQYVIWNNYGLKRKDQDVMSYQLYSRLFEQIGIHEGLITKYHQQTDEESDAYLSGLQTLEYDLLYGENYAYTRGDSSRESSPVGNSFETSDLQMGTRTIQIKDVVKKKKKGYVVKGEGFTPYCQVIYNGEHLQTKWVNSKRIIILDELEFEPDDEPDEKIDIENPEKTPDSFVIVVENGDGIALSYSKPVHVRDTSCLK